MCAHLQFAINSTVIYMCICPPCRDLCQQQCVLEKCLCSSVLCVCACVSMHPPLTHTCVRVCVCAFGAISKEANSLVDRNCYGLEVEPLAAVMQVESHKPHQSQQRYNEAELPNRATPATMRLLLPGQRQAQLGRQHAEYQAGSVGQARGAGASSR